MKDKNFDVLQKSVRKIFDIFSNVFYGGASVNGRKIILYFSGKRQKNNFFLLSKNSRKRM